jgi:hypothetical protein
MVRPVGGGNDAGAQQEVSAAVRIGAQHHLTGQVFKARRRACSAAAST